MEAASNRPRLTRDVLNKRSTIIRNRVIFAGILALLVGFGTPSKADTNAGVRLCIVTPDQRIHTVADAEYARWVDDRHRSGGSTPFQGIILSDSQISEIRQVMTRHHVVPWQPMLSEIPYAKGHTAVLIYRSKGDESMCSLGSARPALRVLEQIIDFIPKESRASLQKSMDTMKSAPQTGGDGTPAARAP